jgi:hypothetical protein
MSRRLTLAAALSVAALLVAACSGDDGAETTTTSTSVAASSSTEATTTTSPTTTTSTTSTTVPSTTTAPASTTSTTVATTTTRPGPTTTVATGSGSVPSVAITSPPNLSQHTAAYDAGLVDFVAWVTLQAGASDPDGDIASIEWFSSDQGFLGSGATLQAALSTMGSDAAQPYVTVRVTDAAGNVTESRVQLVVWLPSDE